MSERDPERRAELYRALQRQHRERAPFVFLYQYVEIAAHPETVDGLLIGYSPGETRYAGIAKR
jgi:peptide/nickel transport system substrate-binding protein